MRQLNKARERILNKQINSKRKFEKKNSQFKLI
jgi:hypothetical protein